MSQNVLQSFTARQRFTRAVGLILVLLVCLVAASGSPTLASGAGNSLDFDGTDDCADGSGISASLTNTTPEAWVYHRTVKGRCELDAYEYWPARLPYAPRGAVDGKVMDSDLGAGLSFWARWGSSSGMALDADEHLSEHPQWSHLDGYLKDRPSQPWTLFTAGQK